MKTKLCSICSNIEIKQTDDIDNLAFELEKSAHIDSGKCQKNYTGPSGGIENACALILWGRLEDMHKFRYKTFISGGVKLFSI